MYTAAVFTQMAAERLEDHLGSTGRLVWVALSTSSVLVLGGKGLIPESQIVLVAAVCHSVLATVRYRCKTRMGILTGSVGVSLWVGTALLGLGSRSTLIT